MNIFIFAFSILLLNILFNVYNSQESDNFFLLYPSEDKNKPYQLHLYNSESEISIINSTEEENMKFISKTKTNNKPIKHLSSVFKYNDKFLIKTCFSPNKIIEIIDENGQSFTPTNNADLSNIKFCYSGILKNLYTINEYFIITYWTESISTNGKETYYHKLITFNMSEKTFSEVKDLDNKFNFYAESCTTLGYKYIYCTIDSSFSLLSKLYDFTIDSNNIFSSSPKISTSFVVAIFSDSMYHKPIGISKETYTLTGKTANYFLTEYHDESSDKTRLVTSLYIDKYSTSFILKLDTLGIYHGINIEDDYIEPNLFNHLLTYNNEIMIIYIMKGAEGKNLLLLNQYGYSQSLKLQTNFNKYSLSNYLREDICDNPKYMQSIFISSFINYDANDREIIKSNTKSKYYKYQKDIGIVISCAKDNGDIFYEAKKIVLPQCLNILESINYKSDLFTYKQDASVIKLDIKNNPNLKSLRNVEIQFLDSNIYNRIIIVQAIKNGSRQTINKATTVYNIDEIDIFRTINYKKGKTYQIPYRIKQTGFSGISSTCHLTSDVCYIETYYEGEKEDDDECPVNHCNECDDKKCIECNANIIGIQLDKDKNLCTCDETHGFNKEPNLEINLCTCKEGYSFYQNIKTCLNDTILNNGTYCISEQDERSLINIYDKISNETIVNYDNGLLYCSKTQAESCNLEIWFKMGRYVFYWGKIDKCIYIIYNHEIIIYSNKNECQYKNFDYRNCFNLNINNKEEYDLAMNNAYEYIPDSNTSSFYKAEDKISFYILNEYNMNKFSSVQLSKACMDKVKQVYNIDSILIFVVNIKKSNIISTQVEYGFYNSAPEHMNEKLNMSICSNGRLLANLATKRQMQYNYYDIYDMDIDEIIINAQIDWPVKYRKSIDELYIKRGIDIFNSSNSFFNDVCYKFTTPEGTDIFLEDRKKRYFINEPLCESNCVQLGYDIMSERAICKCKMKEEPDNYENVTFVLDLDDNFKETFRAPNLQVLKCFFNNKLKWINGGFFLGLILIIIYSILFIILFACKVTIYEKEINIYKNDEEIKLDENNDVKENNYKKKISLWETPFEHSLKWINILRDYEPKASKEGEFKGENKNLQNKNEKISNNKYKRTLNNHNNHTKESSNEQLILKDNRKEPDKKNQKEQNDFIISNSNSNSLSGNHEIKEGINSEKIIVHSKKALNNQDENFYLRHNRYNYENDDKKSLITNASGNQKVLEKNISQITKNEEENSENKEKLFMDDNNPNSAQRITNEIDVNHINQNNNSNNNNINNKPLDINKNSSCFEKYSYNIRTQEELKAFKDKEKSCIIAILKLFFSNYLSNSSLFFILSLFPCIKIYKDCFIVKLLFLLLIITLYMVFNILTEVNTSTLHVIANHEYEEDSSNHLARAINFFFPFIVLYFPISWMRKALSKTLFINRTDKKLEKCEEYFKSHNNLESKAEKNEYKYKKTIGLKVIETDIEKTKNQFEIQSKIIFKFGGILLFINWILITSFCGIYINSFGNVILNIFISIIWSIFFSLILNAISALIKYFNCGSLSFKFAEYLNLKKIISISFNKCCCEFSYLICCYSCCCWRCCDCCKEEFEEDEESKNNIAVN